MNMHKLKLTFGLLCGLLLVPVTSEASSGALWLSDTTALFMIDFGFTDDTFDIEVPIAAKYGVEYNDRVDYTGFTIKGTEADSPSVSAINGLVLGDASVSGTHYTVPKDTESDFTLIILATFSEPVTSGEFSAQITKLPYFMNGKRTTVHQNQLDELPRPILKTK